MHASVSRLIEWALNKSEANPRPAESIQDLQVRLGVSSATFTNWKTRGVSKQGALDAAREFGCSTTWLMHGGDHLPVGAAHPPAANDHRAGIALPDDAIPVGQNKQRRVWVVGKGAGGLPQRIWTDGDYPVGATDLYSEVPSSDPSAFLAEISEDSMIPVLNPKNYAMVEPGTDIDLEDKVLVRLKDGTTLMKRLLSRTNGYSFGSFNDPKILHYDHEEVTWMYYIAFEVPRKKIKTRT